MKIPLTDGEAGWSAEVKEKVGFLRRRGFAVWPHEDGRSWHVEAMIMGQSEMIAMANTMAERRVA